MTLYELANDVTIQGNVRVSTWKGEEEEVLLTVSNTEDFNIYDLELQDERWEDAEVLYMFVPGDGILHIEIENVMADDDS